MILALSAAAVLIPLLYLPGFLISRALPGSTRPAGALERAYERVLLGALLNGWLALILAELGVFSAGLHLALLLIVCAACALAAWRRGGLRLPAAPLGIVAGRAISPLRSLGRKTNDGRPKEMVRHSFGLSSFALGLRSRWEPIAFAAVGLLFAVLVARPFEVVLGARDAGVYATAGFAIARYGGIAQTDELVRQIGLDQQSPDPALRAAAEQAETNLLGTQNPERFIATRLRYSGFLINGGDLERGRVIPQFFHLYPAWIGLLASLLGLRGGLLATGLLGLLGVWGVGMVGRRLAGPWVGLLGALFLALNGVQVWFSRYSTSEACAQFLSFAALYGFAVMQQSAVSSQRSELALGGVGDAYASSLKPQASSLRSRAWFGGLIAGLAAGQLALTRIDFFVIVAPLLLYLLYLWLARRWSRAATACAAALGLLLLHAGLHIALIARAYFFDTLFARLQDKSAIVATLALPFLTPTLREIFYGTSRSVLKNPLRLPIELVLVALVIGALALLRRDGRPLRWLERAALRWRHALAAAVALLVALLGVYGYLIRPQILNRATLAALPGCLTPARLRAPEDDCLALQGYIGAPVADPAHPNALAYLLDAAPRLLRPARLPEPLGPVAVRQDTALRELPGSGAALDRLAAGQTVQPIGKDADGVAYLVKDARGVAGWAISTTLDLDVAALARLPVQTRDVVDRIANPRDATTFSFGNPGESEKIGIAQANLVRVGWYLSPLGVILGVLGFALWCWRGMNRASWLFLAASLVSTIFFVRLAYGTSDLTYIYILRRYVPLTYPALSLGMAYALVALARLGAGDQRPRIDEQGSAAQRKSFGLSSFAFGQWSTVVGRRSIVCRLASIILALALVGYFVATNRALYRHVEYQGALDQLAAIAVRFGPGDVLLFRGEARDTPDLVATPLKYGYGLNTFAIRSDDPGRYAAELAGYVRRWQAQGRQVYLVLGANGAVELPGQWPEPVAPLSLRLPEFQQLRDQKPSGTQGFAFDFTVYRLAPAAGQPSAAANVAVNDFTAQLRGFYRPEQIAATTIAWTNGDALLRLPWPSGASRELTIRLAPGATRPASLGPARACLSYLPEQSFALGGQPFLGEHCFPLGPGMQSYTFALDMASPPPKTGTFLLRIAGDTWVPAEADAAQNDQRRLGVQFGGVSTD